MNKKFSSADVVLESSKKHNRNIKNMEKLNKSIDWNRVEDILMSHYTVGLSGEGADDYPPLLLFKCLLLQKWFHINSDPELENQINDRWSFKEFLQLPLSKPSPDQSMFSRFRSRLTKETMDQINTEILRQFENQGLTINEGRAIDARLVKSASRPISNDYIKEFPNKHNTPEGKLDKNGNPLKFCAKLIDADGSLFMDDMEKNGHFITLDIISKKIIYILLSIVIFLILACVSTQAIRFFLLNPDIHQLSKFNMDAEANIPTYFSTMILFLSGVLLGIIALLKKKEDDSFALHWTILSFIFFALSLDEAATIHEMSINPLKTLLHAGGFFHHAWIIPGAVLISVFAIIFFKFWLHLEYRIRILFFLAAACYIFGAIGFEGIGGYYLDANIEIDFTYILITTAEETLEMIGIVLFIYALLRYLVLSYQKVCIRLTFQ